MNDFKNELHDLLELPWSKTYFLALRPRSLQNIIDEPSYSFSVELNGFIRENFHHIADSTLIDPFRLGSLLDGLLNVKDVAGDILEFGSYKGGSGILMALFLRKYGLKKKIHLFDSFAGLPQPHEQFDKGYKQGMFLSDFDVLSGKITALGLEEYIVIHKGWFKDTVPLYLAAHRKDPICLLHVDCDLYTSTMDCFPSVFPLVHEQGVIFLDDFNDGGKGEKKAVIEQLIQAAVIEIGPAPQVFFYKRKGRENASESAVVENHITYDFQNLLGRKSYLEWLKETTDIDYKSEITKLLQEVA